MVSMYLYTCMYICICNLHKVSALQVFWKGVCSFAWDLTRFIFLRYAYLFSSSYGIHCSNRGWYIFPDLKSSQTFTLNLLSDDMGSMCLEVSLMKQRSNLLFVIYTDCATEFLSKYYLKSNEVL